MPAAQYDTFGQGRISYDAAMSGTGLGAFRDLGLIAVANTLPLRCPADKRPTVADLPDARCGQGQKQACTTSEGTSVW